MLLSIIIPIYNVKQYLPETLSNVLNQSFKNFELILVDDGSTDGSAEICDNFANIDNRVKVIHKENGGVSSARNKGVEFAKGDYIGFVDSDDIIEPEMYSIMIKIAKDNNADVVQCNHNRLTCVQNIKYSGEKRIINGEIFVREIFTYIDRGYTNQVSLCTKIYRRKLFEGIIFPDGRTFEDEQETYKICLKAKKLVMIPDELYHYVKRENSIITGVSAKKMIDKQLSFIDRMIYLPKKINDLEKECVDRFIAFTKTILCILYSMGEKDAINTVLLNMKANKIIVKKYLNKYDRIYFKVIRIPLIKSIILKNDFEPIQKFVGALRRRNEKS